MTSEGLRNMFKRVSPPRGKARPSSLTKAELAISTLLLCQTTVGTDSSARRHAARVSSILSPPFTPRVAEDGLATPYRRFEPLPICARSYRPRVWQYPSQSNACGAVPRSRSGTLLHSPSPPLLPHD